MRNRTPNPLLCFLGLSALVHGVFLWLVPAQARPATVFREQRPRVSLVNLALPAPPKPASPPPLANPPRPRPRPVENPAAIVPVEAPEERAPEYEGPVADESRGEAPSSGETGPPGLPATTAANPALRENAAGRYLALIRSLIDRRKEYPYQARRQGQEGSVLVRFTLTRQGSLAGEPALEKKSRHGRLNASAIEAVKSAAPYPPFPAEIADEEISLQVAVNFSLN